MFVLYNYFIRNSSSLLKYFKSGDFKFLRKNRKRFRNNTYLIFILFLLVIFLNSQFLLCRCDWSPGDTILLSSSSTMSFSRVLPKTPCRDSRLRLLTLSRSRSPRNSVIRENRNKNSNLVSLSKHFVIKTPICTPNWMTFFKTYLDFSICITANLHKLKSLIIDWREKSIKFLYRFFFLSRFCCCQKVYIHVIYMYIY